MSGNEETLRDALDFATNHLPFMPKEAWQVAKFLAERTGQDGDAALFTGLDRIRRNGIEALH
jgi:hypothetical protein